MSTKDFNTAPHIYFTEVRAGSACENRASYKLRAVECVVIDGLREQPENPRAIRLFLQKYRAEHPRLAIGNAATRQRLQREVADARRKLEQTLEAMAASHAPVSTFTIAIADQEREKTRPEAELAAMANPIKVIDLHSTAIERYL